MVKKGATDEATIAKHVAALAADGFAKPLLAAQELCAVLEATDAHVDSACASFVKHAGLDATMQLAERTLSELRAQRLSRAQAGTAGQSAELNAIGAQSMDLLRLAVNRPEAEIWVGSAAKVGGVVALARGVIELAAIAPLLLQCGAAEPPSDAEHALTEPSPQAAGPEAVRPALNKKERAFLEEAISVIAECARHPLAKLGARSNGLVQLCVEIVSDFSVYSTLGPSEHDSATARSAALLALARCAESPITREHVRSAGAFGASLLVDIRAAGPPVRSAALQLVARGCADARARAELLAAGLSPLLVQQMADYAERGAMPPAAATALPAAGSLAAHAGSEETGKAAKSTAAKGAKGKLDASSAALAAQQASFEAAAAIAAAQSFEALAHGAAALAMCVANDPASAAFLGRQVGPSGAAAKGGGAVAAALAGLPALAGSLIRALEDMGHRTEGHRTADGGGGHGADGAAARALGHGGGTGGGKGSSAESEGTGGRSLSPQLPGHLFLASTSLVLSHALASPGAERALEAAPAAAVAVAGALLRCCKAMEERRQEEEARSQAEVETARGGGGKAHVRSEAGANGPAQASAQACAGAVAEAGESVSSHASTLLRALDALSHGLLRSIHMREAAIALGAAPFLVHLLARAIAAAKPPAAVPPDVRGSPSKQRGSVSAPAAGPQPAAVAGPKLAALQLAAAAASAIGALATHSAALPLLLSQPAAARSAADSAIVAGGASGAHDVPSAAGGVAPPAEPSAPLSADALPALAAAMLLLEGGGGGGRHPQLAAELVRERAATAVAALALSPLARARVCGLDAAIGAGLGAGLGGKGAAGAGAKEQEEQTPATEQTLPQSSAVLAAAAAARRSAHTAPTVPQGASAASAPSPLPRSIAPALICMLSAPSAATRQAGAHALGVLGRDEAAAIALVEHGAVGALDALRTGRGARGGVPADTDAAGAAADALRQLARHHAPTCLWLLHAVPAHMRIREGFYALRPGAGPFLRPAEVRALGRAAEGAPAREVVTVDPASDAELQELMRRVRAEVAALSGQAGGGIAEIARRLAGATSLRLGGELAYERYETFSCAAEVQAAKVSAGSDVFALSRLSAGSAWHRALLFKVLADHASGGALSASFECDRRERGAHAGLAWNVVTIEGEPHIVDLLHEVGALYRAGSDDAARYLRVGPYAFSSLASSHRGLVTGDPRELHTELATARGRLLHAMCVPTVWSQS